MSFRRGQHLWALAILLLIAVALTLQASSLLPGHSSDHPSHCCSVCHLAHVSLVNPAQVLRVLAPSGSAWHIATEEHTGGQEARATDTRPRAPPAA